MTTRLLVRSSFQMRTFIPSGNPRNGLGTGHASLEPSALASVKVYTDTYVQSQLAYWIPLGVFFVWVVGMTAVMLKAIAREERLAPAGL